MTRIYSRSGSYDIPLAQSFVLLRARAYTVEKPILNVARDVLARTVDLGDFEGQ